MRINPEQDCLGRHRLADDPRRSSFPDANLRETAFAGGMPDQTVGFLRRHPRRDLVDPGAPPQEMQKLAHAAPVYRNGLNDAWGAAAIVRDFAFGGLTC